MTTRRSRGHCPPDGAPLGSVWLELGDGQFTLIDATDAPVLAQHTWWLSGRSYAVTKIGGRQVYLHRLLLPQAVEVDHRNRNRLDNRRANLRAATHAQNGANREINGNNTSGFKGVSRYRGKWGAAAYDRASREHHGEFAAANEENR